MLIKKINLILISACIILLSNACLAANKEIGLAYAYPMPFTNTTVFKFSYSFTLSSYDQDVLVSSYPTDWLSNLNQLTIQTIKGNMAKRSYS